MKLCDFGSATTERIQPDDTWSQSKRGLIEDEVKHDSNELVQSIFIQDVNVGYSSN